MQNESDAGWSPDPILPSRLGKGSGSRDYLHLATDTFGSPGSPPSPPENDIFNIEEQEKELLLEIEALPLQEGYKELMELVRERTTTTETRQILMRKKRLTLL